MRSPSFLFNQLTDDRCLGITIPAALNLMARIGICSLRSMPYNEKNCRIQPDEWQFDEAYLNRISGWGVLDCQVEEFKKALNYGFPLVVGIEGHPSFDEAWKRGEPWRSFDPAQADVNSGHALCVVGYDDAKRMFKVQNSWGTSGGDAGYVWVTYDMVSRQCFDEAYIVYGMLPLLSVDGPDMLCTTGIYTVSNLQAGDQVEWETDSSIEIVSGQGTGQLTVRKNPREAGEGLLQAKVNGHSLPWKDVQVGLKAPQIVLYEGFWATYGICVGRDYTLRAYDASGKKLSDVMWAVTTPCGGGSDWTFGLSATRTGRGGEYRFRANAEGDYEVRCWQPNTECGMNAVAEAWYDGQYCGGGGGFLLTPNPASGLVTMQLPAGDELSLTVESQSQGSSVGRMVRVYSQHAELMYEGAMTDGMQLDVRGWVRGVYTWWMVGVCRRWWWSRTMREILTTFGGIN